MHFIEAVEQGLVFGTPKKKIETVISKLFFFEDRVIKVYKHVREFYVDLETPSARKEFYVEDFFWNRSMSPEVYRGLLAVKRHGELFEEVDNFEAAEDFYIEMRAIDETKNLSRLLEQRIVSLSEIETLATTIIEKIRTLTQQRKDTYPHLFSKSLYEISCESWEDMRQWMYSVEKHIPKNFTDELFNLVTEKLAKEPYFISHPQSDLCLNIDNNSDNVLFFDGAPVFIDVMPPKENWKVNGEFLVIARTAVDAYALGSKELGDAVYRTYEARCEKSIPHVARLLYEIRAACIQWPYRHMLDEHERALKFKTFALNKIEELKAV